MQLAVPLIVGGTLLQYKGYREAAKAERRMARKDARMMERQAERAIATSKKAFAAAQRKAREEERQARYTSSRLLALAAASGGGVDDPTVIQLLADIDAEGAYRAGIQLYEGEEQALYLREEAYKLRQEAQLRRETGEYRAGAYGTQAMATLLSGAGSLAIKYGGRSAQTP